MITTEQVTQYLQTQGISGVPDFILEAWIEQANSIQDCLDANYSVNTALLIQCYLISLFALGSSDAYISSQTAPSGASRSFNYKSLSERWKSQISLLNKLDKNGCTSDLVPDDPTNTAKAGLWISKASCNK